MAKLIEALQILLKYGNPDYPTHCEHDELTICGIDPAVVSIEDKAKLDELGFFVSESDDCFKSSSQSLTDTHGGEQPPVFGLTRACVTGQTTTHTTPRRESMRIQSEGRNLNMMFVTKQGKQEIRTFLAQKNVLKNGKLASQWLVTTWRGESVQKMKIVSTQTLNANDGILLFGSQGDAVVCEEDAVEMPERYSKYVSNVHRV